MILLYFFVLNSTFILSFLTFSVLQLTFYYFWHFLSYLDKILLFSLLVCFFFYSQPMFRKSSYIILCIMLIYFLPCIFPLCSLSHSAFSLALFSLNQYSSNFSSPIFCCCRCCCLLFLLIFSDRLLIRYAWK